MQHNSLAVYKTYVGNTLGILLHWHIMLSIYEYKKHTRGITITGPMGHVYMRRTHRTLQWSPNTYYGIHTMCTSCVSNILRIVTDQCNPLHS